MSEAKEKRLCLANKPADPGVSEVTSATGDKVLRLQLTQRGALRMPLPLRPPLQPQDFFKRVSSFFPLPFLVLLSGSFPPGKVRCIISFAKKDEII